MRQGNGTDVLGLNDPRNARIGVIYVSANDENAHVINAIQGQARLGRKQVAVVLAAQHKAYQHPEDFDELKRIRNSLQTQVVFIAPGGPGPAEFARQRRFLVYSSLENYTKALHDEQTQKEPQKGWFFRRRQSSRTAIQKETTPEVVALPVQGASQDIVEEKDSKAPVTRMRPIIIGGAEIVAPAYASNSECIDNASHVQKSNDMAQPLHSELATLLDEDSEVASKTGPGIIDLHSTHTRSKETLKLSSVESPVVLPIAVGGTIMQAVSEQHTHQVASPMMSRVSRQSGKVAAVGAGGVNRANGANGVRRSSGSRASLSATSLANTATGGTPPPTMNRGGGRGGGGRRGVIILGLVALLLLTGGVLSAIAYSNPNLLSSVKGFVKLQGSSTVTITPASTTESDSYIIIGVQGTPNASKLQVSARTITGSSPSQSKTVAATGQKQTPGVEATGTLTFKNGLFRSQVVNANTPFTGRDGVKVVNDVQVVIPATNPNTGIVGTKTVSAHALNVGTTGNIVASDINGTCCTGDNSIFVQNSAFSGGQDPQNYTFVQQSDINGVVNALEPSLLQQAENSLKGQVHSNEQLAGSVTCSPSIGQNQNAGDKASSVTVTVSVACKGVAYDQKGALSLVTGLLSKKATNALGSNYALVGTIVTTSAVQNVTSSGVNLFVSAKGVWVYQFSASVQQNLKNLIAGKNVTDAITLLKSQSGISNVSINPNSGTLPTSVSNITFVIEAVQGLSGGSTSSGGASLTPTVTGPGGGLTPQPGNG